MPSPSSLWSERYRPATLKEVVGQEHVVSTLKNILQGEEFPTRILLFLGPSGSGKTSIAEALVNECISRWPSSIVRRIDGSDDRSSSDVHFRIRPVLRMVKPKILLIENVDSLTEVAQVSLSSALQSMSPQTLVIMTASVESHINQHLLSVAIPFQLLRLTKEQVKERLSHICIREELQIDEDKLNSIAERCEGDLRAAINALQGEISRATKTHTPQTIIPPLESYIRLEVGRPYIGRGSQTRINWSEVIELAAPTGKALRVRIRPARKGHVHIQVLLPGKRILSFFRDEAILLCHGATIGWVRRGKKELRCGSLRLRGDNCYLELSESEPYVRSKDTLMLTLKDGSRIAQQISEIL
ncbi:MAG: AAA family ATPase [Candidatus Bathyarchaeia archaeon]